MESVTLQDIYSEIKALREEIAELKKEDLTTLVNQLDKNNQLGSEKDLSKLGINL